MTDNIKETENKEALNEDAVIEGESALNDDEDEVENSIQNRRKQLSDEEEQELLKQASEKWLAYIKELNEQGKVKLAVDNPLESYAYLNDDNSVSLLSPEGKLFSYGVGKDEDGNSVEKITYNKAANGDKPMELNDAVAMVRLAAMQGWTSFKIRIPVNSEDGSAPENKVNDLLYLAMVKINEEAYIAQGEPKDFKPIISISNYKPAEDSFAHELSKEHKWMGGPGVTEQQFTTATDNWSMPTKETPEEAKKENVESASKYLPLKDAVPLLPAPPEEEEQKPSQEEKVFFNGKENAVDADFEVVEEAPEKIGDNRQEQKALPEPEQKAIPLQDQSTGDVIYLGDGQEEKGLSKKFNEPKDAPNGIKEETPKKPTHKGLTPRNQ